eukprot:1623093-Amphidinium_carterae.1
MMLARSLRSQSLRTLKWGKIGGKRKAKFEDFEPGDDTITAASIETLAHAWVAKGHNVTLHPAPAEENVNHKSCISCPFALK